MEGCETLKYLLNVVHDFKCLLCTPFVYEAKNWRSTDGYDYPLTFVTPEYLVVLDKNTEN